MSRNKAAVDDVEVFPYYKEPIFKDEAEESSCETSKMALSFPITCVGAITSFVEPISAMSDLDVAERRFRDDPELGSIPVESEAGVIGLVTRESALHRGK